MQRLSEEGRTVALIASCNDERCARRAWIEFGDLPPSLTLRALTRRAICSWCGSLRGYGVGIELVGAVVTKPGGTVHDLRKAQEEARSLRRFVSEAPFQVSFHRGVREVRRPSPDLLDAAHVRLGLEMCNLYSMTTNQDAMRRLFSAVDKLGNQPPLPGIFPDMEVPIVTGPGSDRNVVRARWGWSKAKFGWVTNIRDLDGWPWRHVIQDKSQRCLVPASSFAEYHPTEKTDKGHKAAVWFKLKGEEPRPPFAFAGFHRHWDWEKDGLRRKADASVAEEAVPTLAMAFLTTEPNEVVAPIHPKAQPVLLTTDAEFDLWLNGKPDEIMELQRPIDSDALEIAFVGEKMDAGRPENGV